MATTAFKVPFVALGQAIQEVKKELMAAVEEVEVLRKRTPRRLEVVLAEDIPVDGLGIDGVVSVDRDGRRVRMLRAPHGNRRT